MNETWEFEIVIVRQAEQFLGFTDYMSTALSVVELRRAMWSETLPTMPAPSARETRAARAPHIKHVVFCPVCTYRILYLAGLTNNYDFHLYYDI
jgi:hypothetical protein